jgi:hypothetical protein
MESEPVIRYKGEDIYMTKPEKSHPLLWEVFKALIFAAVTSPAWIPLVLFLRKIFP